jgi:hypothetical protein
MKKVIFHLELLTSWGLATGKAKRAPKILTSNQQQTLQGLAGTGCVNFDVRKALRRKEISRGRLDGLI